MTWFFRDRVFNGLSLRALRGQAISAAAVGLNRGVRQRRAKFFPEIGDMGLDHVGVVLPCEVEEMFQQLALGEDHERPMHEVLENAVLCRRQIDGSILCQHGLGRGVEGKSSEAKN